MRGRLYPSTVSAVKDPDKPATRVFERIESGEDEERLARFLASAFLSISAYGAEARERVFLRIRSDLLEWKLRHPGDEAANLALAALDAVERLPRDGADPAKASKR